MSLLPFWALNVVVALLSMQENFWFSSEISCVPKMKKVLRFWNNMRVSNEWQNVLFWVNYSNPLNINIINCYFVQKCFFLLCLMHQDCNCHSKAEWKRPHTKPWHAWWDEFYITVLHSKQNTSLIVLIALDKCCRFILSQPGLHCPGCSVGAL